jgi:carbon monoxide dehydrogenase subunit G
MIQFERSRVIDASPAAIWAVLGRFMHVDAFAPEIVKVDALTQGEDGVGSKRRNHFANGGSLVEEVTAWHPGQGFTVALSDMGKIPFTQASARVQLTPVGGQTRVSWGFEYQVKYDLVGWVMGKTLIQQGMSKVIDANLAALDDSARAA